MTEFPLLEPARPDNDPVDKSAPRDKGLTNMQNYTRAHIPLETNLNAHTPPSFNIANFVIQERKLGG